MSIEELAQLCNAQLVGTRERGPHFDGHDFVNVAAERGASAAVASYPTRAMNSPSAFALLQVEDTLTALHKLATNYRRLMPRSCVLTIASIGQSGKLEGNRNKRRFTNLGTRWERCA